MQVGEQSWNVARNAVLAAGWPETIPGTTLDRQCGSSQQAVHFAAATVVSGQADFVVAGGVEVMSRVPMGSSAFDAMPFGSAVRDRYRDREGFDAAAQIPFSQGVGAEMIAAQWGFTRAQVDEYSLASHAKAAEASFDQEIAPYAGVYADEGIRRDTTLEKL